MITEDMIKPLLNQWGETLQTRDPQKVTALYADDAVLIPTVSNAIRYTQAEREAYFSHFLLMEPNLHIDQCNTRILDNTGINSGIYTFSLKNTDSVTARFTFVYRHINGAWKIIEHHSSMMPE